MSLWNVSMVMAPNLFSRRHRGNKRSITNQREEMEAAVGGAKLIGLMIRHQDLLWTVSLPIRPRQGPAHNDITSCFLPQVPKFLLAQVRQMNQASNRRQFNLSRTTSRLLRRKNDRNQVSSEPGGFWLRTRRVLTQLLISVLHMSFSAFVFMFGSSVLRRHTCREPVQHETRTSSGLLLESVSAKDS